MDLQTLVMIALLAMGVMAFSIGSVVVRRSVRQSLLAPLAERYALRPAADDSAVTDAIEGKWDATPIRVRHVSRPWYQRDELIFELRHELPLSGEVRFRRKTRLHRLAHAIGLIPDVDPVDRDFHRHIAPEADHDEDIAALVGAPGIREALMRLVRDRRTQVSISRQGVAVHYAGRLLIAGAGLRRHARPQAAQGTLIELHQLLDATAMALRGHRPKPTEEDAPHADAEGDELVLPLLEALGEHRLGSVLLIGPMMLFVGPAVLVWGMDFPPLTWTLYGLGLATGLALLTLYGGIAYRVLRGRTRSLRDFSLLFTSAAVGLLTLAPGVAAGINGLFDPGPPEPATAVVERRLGDGHHLHIRIPVESSRLLTVAVRSSQYQALERGDSLDVRVMPGALGYPWLLGAASPPER